MLDNEQFFGGQLKKFHEKVHNEADNIVKYFVLGYFVFGLVLSLVYFTWELGVVMGLVSLGIFYLVKTLAPGSLLFRLTVSFLFWHFPLQFILQLHGTYEMYFFYFLSVTVLLFYEDWIVLLPVVLYALATFVIVFFFDIYGWEYDEFFANAPELTYKNALLHIGIMLMYGGVCGLWARLKKKQTQEYGLTNLQMQEQLELMDTNINFADNISKGELNAQYQADRPDKLGGALMEMRESLLEAAERESKERFVNVGLASIGDILRANSDNLAELCDQVIAELVKYMKVNQGGIFILEAGDNEEDKHLELIACRAYERKKYLQKRVEIGQGLVGQAALEKKFIYLKEVPADYVNITSGLGKATPNSLLLVPLQSNGDLVGVLEMASFRPFEDFDIEFLEKVAESIASSIISAKTNQATKDLLLQAREMTEQMQAQEEEMRQNMEEMQATQEEMARTQRELAAKEINFNALINNTTDSIITIDLDYNVVIMNAMQKSRYVGTQYEGLGEGSNALEMLGSVRDEWKEYYDRAFAGEMLKFVLKSSVRGEDTWREYSINPVRNDKNEIIGASIFSRDISDRKRVELENHRISQVMSSLLNTSNDMLLAIDSDYNLIVSNDRFKKGAPEIFGSEVKVGTSLLSGLEETQKKEVRAQYDRALAGESFQAKYEMGDGVLVNRCEPIVNDEGHVYGIGILIHVESKDQIAI
ncbi:GAF domain-containing protein [Fulvivirga sediminis]|uniref:GAF domain-containing protein n=1 Tax=Fulvivirga sediminis TaxID=2803949 RepID=A0A937F5R3_9BACT|nr:GAF domain-containing protein [Fulvivirga sediminis]MBL3654810.1 GAF domain-containing protein [Fulvivirga sediminis]